jgi:3-hydroxyacyl-[acyl-carrier-protein] dehydratase
MDGPAKTLETLDIQQLLELLPHRYPFLMVDRIVDIDGSESAVGIKAVTVNEPQFAGLAQTAGAICIHAIRATKPAVVYFLTIDECKFRQPVLPGDLVEYHVRKLRNRGNLWRFRGEVRVGAKKVAEAVISAMIADQ